MKTVSHGLLFIIDAIILIATAWAIQFFLSVDSRIDSDWWITGIWSIIAAFPLLLLRRVLTVAPGACSAGEIIGLAFSLPGWLLLLFSKCQAVEFCEIYLVVVLIVTCIVSPVGFIWALITLWSIVVGRRDLSHRQLTESYGLVMGVVCPILIVVSLLLKPPIL